MSERPKRIQRKRTKGWKMPEGALYVGRGSAWGNPYPVGAVLRTGPHAKTTVKDNEHAVALFREWALEAIKGNSLPDKTGRRPTAEDVAASLAKLRGKNLACWCPLDQPCHADVLLELANKEPTP